VFRFFPSYFKTKDLIRGVYYFYYMVFWLIHGRRDVNKFKKKVENTFLNFRDDFDKVSNWISHLHSKNGENEKELLKIRHRLSNLEVNMQEIKNVMNYILDNIEKLSENYESKEMFKQLSKQGQTGVYKQTGVYAVQTPVQTGVQTPLQTSLEDKFFKNLTKSEKILVGILLSNDLKLSCEDLAVLMNKNKSTIRGWINSIKKKSESLIVEVIENSGKKRYYINEEARSQLKKGVLLEKNTKKPKKLR